MSLSSLHKWQRVMLFGLILALPLGTLPKAFSIPGLGQSLYNYFLTIGLMLVAYEYVKYGFTIEKKVKIFFTVYIIWQIVCLIHGLYIYQFNELLTIDQIPKLEMILNKLNAIGINIDQLIAIKIWLFIHFTKSIIFINNTVFLALFFVYHLYKNNFEQAFKDIRKAAITLVIVMGIYSFFELLWLKLSLPFAEKILIMINPLLYDPVSTHGWWPPLLWFNQLRSLCMEPSFFGVISIFVLPALWSKIFEKNSSKYYYILIFYFTIMVFATNARTAIILTSIELLLLMIFACLNKSLLKKSLIILLVSIISFSFNLIDFKMIFNIQTEDTSYLSSISTYVESNVVSISDKSSRSNGARLYHLLANINTIKEYPITGVGTSLESAYLDNNLPEGASENSEVKNNWHRYLYEKGVLLSPYPSLNKYAEVCVENGIIGLLLYLLLPAYLIYYIIKCRKIFFIDIKYIALVISMIGLLLAQVSNSSLVVCNGIIWGVLYCKINDIRSNQKLVDK